MKQAVYENLSLMAEYEFTFGGAQRMLCAIAKRMNKPIYVLTNSPCPQKVWDSLPIPGIPSTDCVLSLVVDKHNFQYFHGKKQIKFCHSGSSLEKFIENKAAKNSQWLTHRKRAYDYYKERGFNIELIPKGYIPYDKETIETTPEKKDQGVFISRICPQKAPNWAINTFCDADIPLYIAGNYELTDYASCLRTNANKNIRFILPDEGIAVSLKTRDALLAESKVLVHCCLGGMHDYLEYSILDGLIFNCIPLCITSDRSQFSVVEEQRFGRVVDSPLKAKEALKDILLNYQSYVLNARRFMNQFLNNQEELWYRWESKLEQICSRIA